jgi:hypothetical protein
MLDGLEYTGVDCSIEALNLFRVNCRDKLAIQLDALSEQDSLPAGDVLLLRDVLHHWPTRSIQEFGTAGWKRSPWAHTNIFRGLFHSRG